MTRYRHQWRLLGCIGVLLASTAALGGARTGGEVGIDDVNRFATGALGWVRGTVDRTQYIGCDASAGVASLSAFCTARNAQGVTRQCTTSNQTHIATIMSLNEDSYLVFQWGTDGLCTLVHIENTSTSFPKR